MIGRRVLVRLSIAAVVVVVVALGALAVLIAATSSPELPPPRTAANPNSQLKMPIDNDQESAAWQTDLAYQDNMHAGNTVQACEQHGRWSLTVNPQNVVGYPYAATPTLRDWSRASRAIAVADGICPAPISLTWYGHDPAHPATDLWMASLPASVAASIDSAKLRHYALRHAHQA